MIANIKQLKRTYLWKDFIHKAFDGNNSRWEPLKVLFTKLLESKKDTYTIFMSMSVAQDTYEDTVELKIKNSKGKTLIVSYNLKVAQFSIYTGSRYGEGEGQKKFLEAITNSGFLVG